MGGKLPRQKGGERRFASTWTSTGKQNQLMLHQATLSTYPAKACVDYTSRWGGVT
jgi:hypothetical protein